MGMNKNQQAKKEMRELELEEQKLFALIEKVQLKRQERFKPGEHENHHAEVDRLIRILNLGLLNMGLAGSDANIEEQTISQNTTAARNRFLNN